MLLSLINHRYISYIIQSHNHIYYVILVLETKVPILLLPVLFNYLVPLSLSPFLLQCKIQKTNCQHTKEFEER